MTNGCKECTICEYDTLWAIDSESRVRSILHHEHNITVKARPTTIATCGTTTPLRE